MIENARRQLFLVLLSIVAALACVVTLKVPLGHDLKGGTQLRYEVPADVLAALHTKEGASIEAIMAQTISVIAERIDPNGTLDPTITRSGETGILIELPWFEDRQELKNVLARIANLGKLEMRIVADDDFVEGPVKFTMQAEVSRLNAWLQNPENKAKIKADFRDIRRFNEDPNGPIQIGNLAWYPRLIRPAADGKTWDRPYNGMPSYSKAMVKAYEDADYNNGVIPEAFLKKDPKDRFLVEYLALNMKERAFTGEDLDPSGVGAGNSPRGGLGVNYKIVEALSGEYADWSQKYIGKCSAIVLNGVVKSAPVFESKIPGRGIISGDFTNEEVNELVKVLRTGSLRVEPELMSNESIGPTLGATAIKYGAYSLIAGAVLVFAFMLAYYRVAGTIACVTLVLNVFLLGACMLFMQATITLPGLGGIVLTMGMAVDANVLIYERIREELAKGKDLLLSVRAGFERAMSAILDSNITTFLVGMVLYNIGVGPVRGFAVTLMVGIITTVFTQFFVTRLLFHYALEKKWLVDYRPRSLFTHLNVDFVAYMKPALAGSIALIGCGIAYAVLVAPREVTLGIDFTGGANLRMVLAEPMTDEALRSTLRGDAVFAKEYPNVQVNRYGEVNADGTGNEFNLRLKLNDEQRLRIDAERKEHRKLRTAADAADQAPPPAYTPPYVAELQRVFAAKLVKPAFGTPVTESIPNQPNLKYALVDVYLQQAVDVAKAREVLAKGLSRSQVTPIGDANATTAKDLRIEWTTQASTKPWEIPAIVQKELASPDLKTVNNAPITLSDPFPDAQEIQGRLVNDLRNAAIGALVVALGLIVLYLRVRFHEYKYGVAAVVALIHDVLVAVVVTIFCNHLGIVSAEQNLSMIACYLAIIGYSVNDTIVIFDRIRENAVENTRLGVEEPFRNLINRALNQTMSRTLLTSGLTLLVVIAQFAANINQEGDLQSFAFAMIIGMVSGVYSTIYIAAPILIWLDKGDLSKPTVPPAPVEEEPAPTPAS